MPKGEKHFGNGLDLCVNSQLPKQPWRNSAGQQDKTITKAHILSLCMSFSFGCVWGGVFWGGAGGASLLTQSPAPFVPLPCDKHRNSEPPHYPAIILA